MSRSSSLCERLDWEWEAEPLLRGPGARRRVKDSLLGKQLGSPFVKRDPTRGGLKLASLLGRTAMALLHVCNLKLTRVNKGI